MRFDGKTAFITGGGRGIGEVFAKALAAEGAAVVLAEIDMPAAESAAAGITRSGGKALAVPCDVADESSVDAAVARAVDRFGGIDILINNAALHNFTYGQPVTKLTLDKWRRMLEVNVLGLVICSKACRASMASRGGGVIINMSSSAAEPATTAYGVSKLAVRGLTVGLAQDLAADGIRVYAIAPGLMNTASNKADLPEFYKNKIVNELQLIKREGRPEDLVGAMLFFCSEEASFITGETLLIGGGYAIRN
jgi:NAD(P)-dependent dehydrogenase (short-subunit alcohol dehydrogenase family)